MPGTRSSDSIAFEGLNLRIYNADSVLLRPKPEQLADMVEGDRVLRYVRIGKGLHQTLPALFEIAEDVFQAAANATRATVPDYDWGLARVPNDRSGYDYIHHRLPQGFSLVSSMTYVPDGIRIEDKNQEAINIDETLKDLHIGTRHGIFRWHEGNHTQFLRNAHGLHLIDNELLIADENPRQPSNQWQFRG